MDDSPAASLPYSHTQMGYPILAAGLSFGGLAQLRSLVRDLRAHRERLWLYVPGLLVFAAIMVAFSRLTVTVDQDKVSAGFAGGLARRRFAVHEIESAEAVKIPRWAGFGMRFTPSGWIYNVWGRQAVRLKLTGASRRFTIGTDDAEQLLAAIAAAQAAQAPAAAA